MGLGDTIIRLEGKFADIDRRLMETTPMKGARLFLLTYAVESSQLRMIREITSGYRASYSDWRQQIRFEIATLDETFKDDMAQTSHVGFGPPYLISPTLHEFLVYGTDPSRRDVIEPIGDSPFWKLFVTREPQKRFRIEV